VTMIPGLRYDFYTSNADDSEEKKTSTEFSPKFALQIRPIEQISIFGSWGKAFRAPNLNELFPTGTHFVIAGFGTNSFITNTELEPQTTITREVGMGLRFRSVITRNDQFKVKGARYWIKGQNFIDTEVINPSPPACFPPNCNGTTQSINVPSASLQGYEIEGSYESKYALFEAGYAEIDGQNNDTEAPLGVLTPDKLTLHAAAKLPQYNSRLGWRLSYFDDFTNTTDVTLLRSGYYLSDVYAHWSASKDSFLSGLGITVGVDNLFDKKYSRIANNSPEPGRNYKATLRYSKSF